MLIDILVAQFIISIQTLGSYKMFLKYLFPMISITFPSFRSHDGCLLSLACVLHFYKAMNMGLLWLATSHRLCV